jgi:uncharacterized protein YbjT (DUF2867 family)
VILVTGGTGRVGHHLLERLEDAHAEVTAMVRVPAKAADLPPGIGHLVGTLDEPPALEVLQRYDRIFLLSPAIEAQLELEVRFIDAVVLAGHKPRIVKLVVDGFQDPDCEVRFMRSHRQIAAHLDATGLMVSYLAANLFMENLIAAAEDVRLKATLAFPAGTGRVGFIAASDIAAAAAQLLLSDDFSESLTVLTGPESLAFDEVAARVSAVFARQVDYTNLAPGSARKRLRAERLPSWQIDGELELFEWIRNGGFDLVSPELPALIGRQGRPVAAWLSDTRGAFLEPPIGGVSSAFLSSPSTTW